MKAVRCLYVVLCMVMMTIINNITHEHVAVLCQVRAGDNNTGKLMFHVHDLLKLNFNIYFYLSINKYLPSRHKIRNSNHGDQSILGVSEEETFVFWNAVDETAIPGRAGSF